MIVILLKIIEILLKITLMVIFTNEQMNVGLSAPVPRGRKGRKSGKKLEGMPKKAQFGGDLSKLDIDIDGILVDTNYKKHLKRHSNK